MKLYSKHLVFVLGVSAAFLLSGCQQGQLMTVDFKLGEVVEYKFVSERDITLDLSEGNEGQKNTKQMMTEKMELMMSYQKEGIEDEFGRSTIRATCKSAKVTRRDFDSKVEVGDSVEKLKGKSFVMKISATGQIEDYSDLERVVQELGKYSLVNGRASAKVKKADMIGDFAASQLYLWDATGRVKNPGKGVTVGQTWSADQVVSLPMPVHIVKNTMYTLSSIEDIDGDQIAHIDLTFTEGDRSVNHWQDPYQEIYSLKGMFAFLRGYGLVSFSGSGEQLFNIDAGVVQKETQNYKAVFNVAFPMALGSTVPKLIVDQRLSVELVN